MPYMSNRALPARSSCHPGDTAPTLREKHQASHVGSARAGKRVQVWVWAP